MEGGRYISGAHGFIYELSGALVYRTLPLCHAGAAVGLVAAALVLLTLYLGAVFIGDLFTAGSLLINRDMSACRMRNVLPDMVEVPESSHIDGRIWSLAVLTCP